MCSMCGDPNPEDSRLRGGRRLQAGGPAPLPGRSLQADSQVHGGTDLRLKT